LVDSVGKSGADIHYGQGRSGSCAALFTPPSLSVLDYAMLAIQYNGEKYAGLARILHPPDGAFQGANALPGAARSNPELRWEFTVL